MTTASTAPEKTAPEKTEPPGLQTADVVVVGAGFSGLYALYRLRGLGLTVVCLEAGDGVGGTWYWNRYPGARVDIESMEYSYSFDDELQQEWKWPELFSPQPDLERYANHVADRFHLRDMIRFEARVNRVRWDEGERRWHVQTDNGYHVVAKWVISATGSLDLANLPDWPGIDTFEGTWYHASKYPKDAVDLTGKRVGIIGTGSSGIQAITAVGAVAGHLTVFQRTAQYSLPATTGRCPRSTSRSGSRTTRSAAQICARAAHRHDAARRPVHSGGEPRRAPAHHGKRLELAQRPDVHAHVPRHQHQPGGQRDPRRLRARQAQGNRQRPGHRGKVDPQGLPHRRQAHLHGHRVLGDVQPPQR